MVSRDIKTDRIETSSSSGTLYIVATPLGNLEDITFRAVRILKEVDIIAAEDTRHSKRLLNHYGIDTRLISCHEHNEENKAPYVIDQLKKGQNIALISDAGTPSISDPGYKLVRAVAKEGIKALPIPGCSAAIAGLSVSGLPTDSFFFLGFLPKKQQKQRQAIEAVKDQSATLIVYESPKRVKTLIANLIKILGDRKSCLAREITKLHEEYIRGNLSFILEKLNEKETVKGECSIFVGGGVNETLIDEKELEKIIRSRLSDTDLGTSKLARQISKQFNFSKNKIYELILKIQNQHNF